jgi:hypothetical protein
MLPTPASLQRAGPMEYRTVIMVCTDVGVLAATALSSVCLNDECTREAAYDRDSKGGTVETTWDEAMENGESSSAGRRAGMYSRK